MDRTLVIRSYDRVSGSDSTDFVVKVPGAAINPGDYAQVQLLAASIPVASYSLPAATLRTLQGTTPGTVSVSGGFLSLSGAATALTTAFASASDATLQGTAVSYSESTGKMTFDFPGSVTATLYCTTTSATEVALHRWLGLDPNTAQNQATTISSTVCPGAEDNDPVLMIGLPDLCSGAAQSTGTASSSAFAVPRTVTRGSTLDVNFGGDAPSAPVTASPGLLDRLRVTLRDAAGAAYPFSLAADWSCTIRLRKAQMT